MTAEARRRHWAEFQPKITWLKESLGRELVARTISWLRDGRFWQTLDVCKDAAAVVLGDQRSGDQYGTLYAGCWMLMEDRPPEQDEIRELMASEDLEQYIEDQEPEGRKALMMLLDQVERVDTANGAKHLSIAQMLGILEGLEEDHGCTTSEVEVRFKQLGFKLEVFNGETCLLVSRTSTWIQDVLRDTPYRNLQSTLKTLPGVRSLKPTRFSPRAVARAMSVPLHLIG
jgi:hypothetical protein